jgi:hypothetical protein
MKITLTLHCPDFDEALTQIKKNGKKASGKQNYQNLNLPFILFLLVFFPILNYFITLLSRCKTVAPKAIV